MTIDELAILATEAEVTEEARQSTFGMRDRYQIRRAGIRAVVEALRDELRREWFLDDSGLESVERWMNEILASDGVEAEPTVGQRLIKAAKEAAAIAKGEVPAAAPVCEWTDLGPEWSSSCKVRFGAFASTKGRFFCPSCGKPISFKSEAAR